VHDTWHQSLDTKQLMQLEIGAKGSLTYDFKPIDLKALQHDMENDAKGDARGWQYTQCDRDRASYLAGNTAQRTSPIVLHRGETNKLDLPTGHFVFSHPIRYRRRRKRRSSGKSGEQGRKRKWSNLSLHRTASPLSSTLLASASLSVGLGAVIADKGLSVGLRQPFGLPATPEPSQHCRPHAPSHFGSNALIAGSKLHHGNRGCARNARRTSPRPRGRGSLWERLPVGRP
jgi:hypothetical protein